MSGALVSRFIDGVCKPLKREFVGRDEVVDLIALALVAGEHLFLFGPPGTAKSLLVRRFAQGLSGTYFESMLTRFSEPNELFGPVDLVRLREGVIATVTTGMLPEAEFVFLDELFNANSAILNNLLTILNERMLRRGREVMRLPLLSAFAASNQLPREETLQALFDRFLLRVRVDPLPREQMRELLVSGWNLEQAGLPGESSVAASSLEELRELSRQTRSIVLDPVLELHAEVVTRARDLGVAISDRRAIKMLKLVAASAVLAGREKANGTDLWVFRHVWDRVEQIGPLGSLVDGLLSSQVDQADPHPRAFATRKIDAEALAGELAEMQKANRGSMRLVELARFREKVQSLCDRAIWIEDAASREHLLSGATALLESLE